MLKVITKIGLAAILTSTITQQASAVQINWTYINGTSHWTDDQKKQVKAAANILARRMGSASVHQCTFRNYKRWYTTGVPGSGNWNTQQFNAWMDELLRCGGTGTLHINFKTWDHKDFSGQAYVGNYVKTEYLQPNGFSLVPMCTYNGSATIELSTNYMNDVNSLAGTMAHELLHQMGNGHPNGYNDENFITVYGDCVQNDGQYFSRAGLGLTSIRGMPR